MNGLLANAETEHLTDAACNIFQWIRISRSSQVATWSLSMLKMIEFECTLFKNRQKLSPSLKTLQLVFHLLRIRLDEGEIEAIGDEFSLWNDPYSCIELFLFVNPSTSKELRDFLIKKYELDCSFKVKVGTIYSFIFFAETMSIEDLIQKDIQQTASDSFKNYFERVKVSPISVEFFTELIKSEDRDVVQSLLEVYYSEYNDIVNLERLWHASLKRVIFDFLLDFLPKNLTAIYYDDGDEFNKMFKHVIKFAWRAKNIQPDADQFCMKLKSSLPIGVNELNLLP